MLRQAGCAEDAIAFAAEEFGREPPLVAGGPEPDEIAHRLYVRRLRDVKYHEAVYDFLNKQLEASRIDEAKDAILVQVVDKAVAPERKSGPHRLLIVLVSAAIAFLLSCLGILLIEFGRCAEKNI